MRGGGARGFEADNGCDGGVLSERTQRGRCRHTLTDPSTSTLGNPRAGRKESAASSAPSLGVLERGGMGFQRKQRRAGPDATFSTHLAS